ncbi:MAG: ATP-binding protein, partial [Xanthobacteraceae bacterium]
FVPTVEGMIFVTDVATAVLLFGQYFNFGSRGLLILADGYLFSGLIVIPHGLSYPGAFAPGGLFVFGLQTTPWLYTFWHFGFSAAALGYACFKSERPNNPTFRSSPSAVVFWNVVGVLLLLCTLTGIAAAERFLPRLVADQIHFTPMANYVTEITLATSISAVVLLWIRKQSMLDLWLLVTLFATVAEQTIVSQFIASRFSLGFYSSRVFSVAVSTIVLVAMLSEVMSIYARLARANRTLQRERDSKLMNLEAAIAAVAHEIRQPLTGIATKTAAARRFLDHVPPDTARVQAILDEVTSAGFRTNEVIDSVRALFRNTEHEQQLVDINDITLEAMQILRKEFDDHLIAIDTQLAPSLPYITGHKGQLREVILNLFQNSIDAMAAVVDTRRKLQIETKRHGHDKIAIFVEDNGPGIDPNSMTSIFDAFMTTKIKGMGLGLAISQMIVERHNGDIHVTSDTGRGARFQITLPIKAASAL